MTRHLERDHRVVRHRIDVTTIRAYPGADDVDVRLKLMLGLRPAGRLDHPERGPIHYAVRIHHEITGSGQPWAGLGCPAEDEGGS